jgi:hypothetical protein
MPEPLLSRLYAAHECGWTWYRVSKFGLIKRAEQFRSSCPSRGPLTEWRRVVVNPDIDRFGVTSGWPVTRPEHGQLGFFCLDWSMRASAITHQLNWRNFLPMDAVCFNRSCM